MTTTSKTLTLKEICQLNDLSVELAEKALSNLQCKGLVSGFVPGDLNAPIVMRPAAQQYVD